MDQETERPEENSSSAPEISRRRFRISVLRLLQNSTAQDLIWYACIALAVALACPILVFAPLFLSGIESSLFGTSHVEDFFRLIQLHDELGKIYTPVIDMLRLIFNL